MFVVHFDEVLSVLVNFRIEASEICIENKNVNF